MRRILLTIIIIALLMPIGCKKETTEIPQNENSCIVTFVAGKAFIINEENTELVQLTVGDKLFESSIVKTEDDGVIELKIGDGSLVRIKENSQLEITKLYKDDEVANTKLHLSMGKILAVPEEVTEGSSFEIETESITAGVRGTEFIVVVSETRVSKVAVKKGLVRIQKRIKIESSLNRIREIDPDLAKKLEDAVREEIILEPDEKIEISYEKIVELESEVTNEIVEIAQQLEEVKDSVTELEEIVEKVKDKKIVELSNVTRTVVSKKVVTKKEWKKDFNRDDFKKIDIKKAKERIRNLTKSEETNTDIAEVTTETDSTETDITDSTETDTAEIETAVEKEPVAVVVFEKIGSAGATFSDKYTVTTSSKKNIYVVNKATNKIIAYNGKSGKVIWKYSDPSITTAYSPAIPYKDSVVIPTETKILVMDSNGKLLLSKDIEKGPVNWMSSVIAGNKVIIPTQRSIFMYDNSKIAKMPGIEFKGVNNISATKNELIINDTLKYVIKVYNMKSSTYTWESEPIDSFIFTPAVVVGKYLVSADSVGSLYRYSYKDGKKSPTKLSIGTGVLSNLIVKGSTVYFVANNGALYSVNVKNFSAAKKIYVIDKAGDKNIYAAKQLLRSGDDFYFSSNSGKLFHYNSGTGKAKMLTAANNAGNTPLIGTPAKVGDAILVVDAKSNIYKRHTVYK